MTTDSLAAQTTPGPLEKWFAKHGTTGLDNQYSEDADEVFAFILERDAITADLLAALKGLMDCYGPDAKAPDIMAARAAIQKAEAAQ